TLLRNETPPQGSWLGVLAEGRDSPRSAHGARLRVVAGGAVQTRSVGSQTSYLSQNGPIEHFGLGAAERVDTLEVIWPRGGRDVWTSVAAGRAVRAVEGQPGLEEVRAGRTRADVLRFWETFREATRLRIDGRLEEAAGRYEAALALDPEHEDALYYLGSLRLALGDYDASRAALGRLVETDPGSARAHSQLGVLHACPADGAPLDLDRAASAFERAWTINREQTGPPQWLGWTALLAGDIAAARGYFEAVLGSDPGSLVAGALLGYVAWREGDLETAVSRLAAAVERAAEVAGNGGSDPGLREGDTRRDRPLFASAMSCAWLADRLASLVAPAEGAAMSASTVEARYGDLDAAFRSAAARAAEAGRF
ncbi:MAG: ASPIC/UnbV domain-containing protein, partial [Gemmatimonadota bacterium]|nr:ASPIC/UnbV domain-containing protein [Gemmatimonadota bacterium]